ncbi:MAG: hypothetical protein AABX80_00845 [Nanoarchaeota archaeon]
MLKENRKLKKGQEEMIGFALIIILVSVILLVFLAFSLNKPKTEIESYEVNSFLQTSLQYTTTCQTASGIKKFNAIKDLVFECDLKNKCSNEENTCEVLNETLTDILKESWPTGEDRPNKGYELTINTGENLILSLQEGNLTKNCRGSSQSFSKAKSKKDFTINFKACS